MAQNEKCPMCGWEWAPTEKCVYYVCPKCHAVHKEGSSTGEDLGPRDDYAPRLDQKERFVDLIYRFEGKEMREYKIPSERLAQFARMINSNVQNKYSAFIDSGKATVLEGSAVGILFEYSVIQSNLLEIKDFILYACSNLWERFVADNFGESLNRYGVRLKY